MFCCLRPGPLRQVHSWGLHVASFARGRKLSSPFPLRDCYANKINSRRPVYMQVMLLVTNLSYIIVQSIFPKDVVFYHAPLISLTIVLIEIPVESFTNESISSSRTTEKFRPFRPLLRLPPRSRLLINLPFRVPFPFFDSLPVAIIKQHGRHKSRWSGDTEVPCHGCPMSMSFIERTLVGSFLRSFVRSFVRSALDILHMRRLTVDIARTH